MREIQVSNWVYFGPIIVCVMICTLIAGLGFVFDKPTSLALSGITLVISIPVCIAMAYWDVNRIVQYLASVNRTLLKVYWEPFAPGWLSHRLVGSYEILYRDGEKRHYSAICRTGWLEGVYFTHEQVISQPDQEFYFRGKWDK